MNHGSIVQHKLQYIYCNILMQENLWTKPFDLES